MEIKIDNCNNIDSGIVNIDENKLNIKYAMNGTGKSTIARALELHIKGNDAINDLMPFKLVEANPESKKPTISGLNNINTIAIYNDSYINQFAFRQDEVLANSFEVFVKTPDYDKHIDKIEKMIVEIKDTFTKSTEIDSIIKDLGILSDSFGKAKSGYSEAGAIAKGIGNGNKITNVPKSLESYTAYLQSSVNVKWIKWQMEGNKEYLSITENCPFCTSPTKDKQEIITQVSKVYDPKQIEHANVIISVLESLSKYFSKAANEQLTQLKNNIDGLSSEHKTYLMGIKRQIDGLRNKMLDLRGLTYFSLKDVDEVAKMLNERKIDLPFFPELNSESTGVIVEKINIAINKVLEQVGNLQGEVNQQNQLIKRTIEENKSTINEFLKNAGYRYFVDVIFIDQKYKMILRHIDCTQAISDSEKRLSYGEKNAFSIILFMYECLAKNPDIIILDDPISSFDRNKKYAVIDMLFQGARSLRNKTVLMMTHDLEPIIDMLYTLSHKYNAPKPTATFIEYLKGIIKELPITRDDILTFKQICDSNICNSTDDIVKLVYYRRCLEVMDNKGHAYQLVSNLFKKREAPLKRTVDGEQPFTDQEVSDATEEIKRMIPAFNYHSMCTQFKDEAVMKNEYNNARNNYEKLQIFRIYQGEVAGNDVVNKFIKETFHIENEYIMQINPCKYDIVPSYIIDECDKIVNGVTNGQEPTAR